MRAQKKNISELLNDLLKEKQKKTGGYSLRALARDLDLSPSFVSRALAGKKSFSQRHLNKLFKIFDIDKETQVQLTRKFAEAKLGVSTIKRIAGSKSAQTHLGFERLGKRSLSLLSEWFHIVVLEAFTASNFTDTIPVLAQKVGISTRQVEESLVLLEKLEIIEKIKGRYHRNSMKIRMASSASKPEIRAYHRAMISKANNQLEKTDEASFDLRLITGITLGANPEKLDKAKAILNEAIHKASEILGSDPCTEVYQINLQLFPLLKK